MSNNILCAGSTGHQTQSKGQHTARIPLGITAKLCPETRQGHIVVCVALWSVLSFLTFSTFLYTSVIVEGVSMSPNLQPGDRYVLNCWFHRVFPVDHGELVVIKDRHSGETVVKRIVALPEDTVQIRNDGLYVNDRRVIEDYLPNDTYTHPLRLGGRIVELHSSEYFVLGDNRSVSEDSRHYGPVRSSDILGVLGPII